jgi:hypothetical protein
MLDHRFYVFPIPDPKLEGAQLWEKNWIHLDVVDIAVCQTM